MKNENLIQHLSQFITTFVNFIVDRIFHHRGLQIIFPELVQMLIVEQAWTEIIYASEKNQIYI